MPTICFLYKRVGSPTTYYGKYIWDYSPFNRYELDVFILPMLVSSINHTRKMENIPEITEKDISIGILSLSLDEHYVCCENEFHCFDFYYFETGDCKKPYRCCYLHGKELDLFSNETVSI
jgi:hypothetical protein